MSAPLEPGRAPDNADPHGRVIDYLRIAVTDRCNLRCLYCMPEQGVACVPHEDLLRFEELWRVARVARGLGFVKFRITGGEPLIVRDALTLIAGLREATAGATLGLTTNGTRLAELAPELRRIGIDRINISLDSLDPARYRALARRGAPEPVVAAIDRCLELSFGSVKVNVVVVPGINEDDIFALAELARTRPIDVRFIERMPIAGAAERAPFLGVAELLRRLRTRYELERVAPDDFRAAAQHVYRSPALRGRLGIVAPRSEKFCERCHRLRLTPGGTLQTCLLGGDGVDLRPALRAGIDDAGLVALIRTAIARKPDAYDSERGALARPMAAIGG